MTPEEAIKWFKDSAFYHRGHEPFNMAIEALNKQIPIKPYQDYNGHDIWRCGKCGATICNIYHTEVDEDSKNYAKFCIHCGSAIEWEST